MPINVPKVSARAAKLEPMLVVQQSNGRPLVSRWACMFSVKSGAMEPAQASAITGLAKATVSITNEIEMEQRLAALEQAAGINQGSGIRRVK